MFRKILMAAPLILALASPAVAASSASPVFGNAVVKPMTVTQAQNVKGKGYYAQLYGYYGIYYLSQSLYYANYSQYMNGSGQGQYGNNTYYYYASTMASYAAYYLNWAGYYSVNYN